MLVLYTKYLLPCVIHAAWGSTMSEAGLIYLLSRTKGLIPLVRTDSCTMNRTKDPIHCFAFAYNSLLIGEPEK